MALGALFFAAYLLLSPPVSGDMDSSEFTLVLATNGVAHPTGYPLFTILGHGFVRAVHALGAPWPLAANAWSAAGGGVAMALFHMLCVSLSAGREGTPWTVVPALLFGLNPMWTGETTLAEVYSWHVAWSLGAGLFFTGMVRRLASPAARTRDEELIGRAALWGALCGVGAAHHLTAVFVVVPLSIGLVIALVRAGRWRWSLAFAALASSLAPVSSYGIIAWRAFHPAAIQWPVLVPTWPGVLRHITGAQYRGLLGHYAPSAVQRVYLARYVYPYAGLALATLLVLAWRARGPEERLIARTLCVAALLSTAYAFGYGAIDPSSYFLTGMAIGFCALGPLCLGLLPGRPVRRTVSTLVSLSLAVAVAIPLVLWTKTAVQRRQACIQFESLIHRMWTSIPFTSGFVAWGDDMYMRLREYQLLNGEKPALSVVNPFLLSHPLTRRRFIAEHGFDPVAGIADQIPPLVRGYEAFTPARESLIVVTRNLILENINRQTPLPVVEFLPESVSVRLLRKPPPAAP